MTKEDQQPTPEFLQHHSVEQIQTAKAGKKRTRVTDQRYIDYYYKHGHITDYQFNSAERLLSLYNAAGRTQRLTKWLDGTPSGGHGDQSEHGAHALMDFFKLRWLMGKETFTCVEDVVIHDFSAPDWAKRNGRNPKAATEILRMSLDHLEDSFKRLRDPLPDAIRQARIDDLPETKF